MTAIHPTMLQVRGLGKKFGGFEAVSDLSFDLQAGEIMGLVGPNGAGKTTTFNLISGFLGPSAGSVVFRGDDITGKGPDQIARQGLVRTFQLNRLFSKLTVSDNVRNGCHQHERGGVRRFLLPPPGRERRRLDERVARIVETVGLTAQRDSLAEDLSYGDQKLLGIGIAVAARPELIMLDEPFAGMNPTETSRCSALVKHLVEEGMTIFLVDHNMRAIMGICDRVLVLNFGRKIAEGAPERIQSDPNVVACYLGRRDPQAQGAVTC